ncbi:NACHT domain-containing protein [Actinomycetospora lemnae]|uniref:AAA+ ATPase domain-containing protein n=1 Tax=Actinomycetospora lemnae TaxID=3019891 RepID=A0ABT5T2I3_9PSEU|nr:hypothetical protein [Actinomycetospora sp. DW7H6]MDD7968432.1 hypothetical protein [Actinomycetospora sp. DW7H6]
MPEPSSASVGGAGGAAGVGLQDRVFAWAAAAMVAEQPLLGELVAGPVARVGAQTGHELDDVVVQTTLDNYALVQVKARLSLGTSSSSPLGKALQQAVAQYLAGPLRSADGAQRAVDPSRDALVLCTDSSAPATIRRDLPVALRRVVSHPPGTPLDQELNAGEEKALGVVLAHVRRLWVENVGHMAGDEALRGFLRALRVITVSAAEGEADQRAAIAQMSASTLSAADASEAWGHIVSEAHAASEERRWLDRAAVGQALANHRIYLVPPSRYAADIQALQELSIANLRALESEAGLPVGDGVFIERSVGEAALADDSGENLLIVGDAGTGKSAVAQQLARARSVTQTVVMLRASDIAGVNRLRLGSPLSAVLAAWTGPAALLVIDGVDALRGAEDREVLSALVLGLVGARWQTVATVRRFDARNNVRLKRAFRGDPLSGEPTQVDTSLARVRHLLVGDLTESELETGLASSAALGSVAAVAQPELRVLLRNPFNLRLAAELAPDLSINELLAIRSRLELLEAYWGWRVVETDQVARVALLRRLCRVMISARRLEVAEAEPVVAAVDSSSVEALLSAGVISGGSQFGDAAPRVLSFAHNILFDYATAIYVLLDPSEPQKLLPLLDDDPSLPLVARPSLEIAVDLLWSRAGGEVFWPLLLELAASPHELTSLAFAGRLLALVQEPRELEPLTPERGRPDQAAGLSPEQKIVSQVIGALRTSALPLAPDGALRPLAALARGLAENAASSVDLGLSFELLRALRDRFGDATDEDDRARAVAALLEGCRADPANRERLAGAALRLVSGAVVVSTEVRGAVGRLLDDRDALEQWGGTVLTWLPDVVVALAAHDRELSRRVASAIVTFRETRDEQVAFLDSPLLPMRESRAQQAQHGVWRLGQVFGELCAADLSLAALIFCDLAPAPPAEPDARWSLSVPGATGSLGYGSRAFMSPHDVEETAAHALAGALARAGAGDARAAVAALVANLRNVFAWSSLLTPEHDDDAVELGQAVLPALASGALLAHPVSAAAAAGLVAALADSQAGVDGELETAVLNAHSLLEAEAAEATHDADDEAWVHDVLQRQKDALTGCLRPDAVTSPALVARLAEIGPQGTPRPEPPVTVGASVSPWTATDRLREQGIELKAETDAVVRRLDEELRLVQSHNDERPDAQRRLPDLFTEADNVFEQDDELPQAALELLLDAAGALARDERVGHDSDRGRRLVELLLWAADQSECGSFLDSGRAWSPGFRDRGVSGLVTLLGRADWRESDSRPEIARVVGDALSDTSPLVRMLAAHAVSALHAGGTATDTASAIADLIRNETDEPVRQVLVRHLARGAARTPDIADATIDQVLGDHGNETVDPASELGRTALSLLAYLALVARTPSAVRRVEMWCADAVARSAYVAGFAQHARDYLNRADALGQNEVFRLLATATDVARTRWARDAADSRPGDTRSDLETSELQAAAHVANTIAEQIYFASGATDGVVDDGQLRERRGDLDQFARLAFPILSECASLGLPEPVHHVVQTMVFLAPSNESRALTAIAEAVPSNTPYAGDSLAGGLVMPYLRRLLTEHRHLVLVDDAGSSAFRRLLEVFAGAGNSEALELAYTFADVFR